MNYLITILTTRGAHVDKKKITFALQGVCGTKGNFHQTSTKRT